MAFLTIRQRGKVEAFNLEQLVSVRHTPAGTDAAGTRTPATMVFERADGKRLPWVPRVVVCHPLARPSCPSCRGA